MFDFEYHKMIIWIEKVGGVELCQMPFGSLKVITLVINQTKLYMTLVPSIYIDILLHDAAVRVAPE